MREAIRASGPAGQRRVEATERRRDALQGGQREDGEAQRDDEVLKFESLDENVIEDNPENPDDVLQHWSDMMDRPDETEHNDDGEDVGMYSPATQDDDMPLDDGPADALPMAVVYGKTVVGVEGAMGVPPDEPAGETPSP